MKTKLKKALAFLQINLSLVIKLILILSVINAVYFSLWHIMSTNIFLLILMFLPQIISKSSQIKIPKEVEFLLFIFVISTLFLGKVRTVAVLVFFGIAIGFIGFLILFLLYSGNQIKKNYFLILFFSFNFAVAFGFALELAKYYLKKLLGHEITAGIYTHTMTNMSFVIVGAIIASLFGYAYMKSHRGIINAIVKKFVKKNPSVFSKATDWPEEILELIEKGETSTAEFKSTLRTNLHTKETDRKIENSALKTIVAFLNSNGGTLLIGVSNSGEILGIEKDNFASSDKFQIHFTNLIKSKIGKEHLPYIHFKTILIEGKTVFKVECKRSKKQVFLKENQEEEFYTRAGPSTIQLKGSELIEFVNRRF